MLLFIYRLLCGYLYVKITTENPAKILNLCAAKGIGIWRVTVRENTAFLKIGITSFKKLRIYKRKIPCRIHITQKVGLPFFISKNKRRYGMVCGLALFIAIIYFMSGCVWNICISGNKNIKSRDIMASLNKIGIYEGAFKTDIDPEEKRNELLLEQKGLAWAAINIEGTKLTVDVTESKTSEERAKDPSNLISGYDGIVRKIEVKNGVTQIKIGDTVQKGQLLVSGMLEYSDGRVGLVRSMGSIMAEVDFTFQITQPLKVTEFVRTGEKFQRKVLSFWGLKIPLFLGGVEPPCESYREAEVISSGNSYLPIKIIAKNFYKTKEKTFSLTKTQAEKRALKKSEEKLKEIAGNCEIIAKKQKIILNDKNLVITTEIKCLKDIVFEEKLLLDTSN